MTEWILWLLGIGCGGFVVAALGMSATSLQKWAEPADSPVWLRSKKMATSTNCST
jgi:hypothetical protein